MSTYYTYYLGYKKENSLYPLGPFDFKGKIFPVVSHSASFASSLYNEFWRISECDIKLSDDLIKTLLKDWGSDEWDDSYINLLSYLPIDSLPKCNSSLEEGYFLIEDVKRYLEKEEDDFDLFYEKMNPLEYAERLRNEIIFGAPQPETNEFGGEYVPHSCRDYMYFRYKKTTGLAAEVSEILKIFYLLTDTTSQPDDIEYVVICVIG